MGQYSLPHARTHSKSDTKHIRQPSLYIMQNLPLNSTTSLSHRGGWKETYSPTCRWTIPTQSSLIYGLIHISQGHSDRPNYNNSLTNHRIRMSLKERGGWVVRGIAKHTKIELRSTGILFLSPQCFTFNRLLLVSGLLENGALYKRLPRWHKFNRSDNDRWRTHTSERTSENGRVSSEGGINRVIDLAATKTLKRCYESRLMESKLRPICHGY